MPNRLKTIKTTTTTTHSEHFNWESERISPFLIQDFLQTRNLKPVIDFERVECTLAVRKREKTQP